MENSFENIRYLAIKLVTGEELETQEEIDFYNDNKTFLKSDTLNSGDVILLAFGAHGFEMLEDAEMIEVKQGPYAGDDDKTRFDPE